MIEVVNLNKTFEENHVLKDVSATFLPGKTNLIIGKSGSGKTVLLKCIIGLHNIDSGQILYNKQNLPEMNPRDTKLLRQKVGMLFQGSALFDSISVLENVLFPLEMFSSMSKSEQVKRAEFCLERVNIDPSAFSLFPAEISGGMQKRVAIARAIVLNPLYLFCDEPNSGLDPQTSRLIDKLIHDITIEYKMTTIINTHDMNSVIEIGENVIYIDNGEKAWQGENKDIFSTENKNLNDFLFASKLTQSN
ncbi:ABC transporter ATP-binding protein [Microbacter margulisiae]|uniref:Phospholipid/cholesterol/gamma-HCH transport system ATP-binding protein n=1 Tax=Microbacter margulisiae TaxID=1350067 RepID=A0A7W5DQ07_9PORP|nr:ATP-binding cassette domain-containing protein [Microbacter margulisiae]MBB3186856.1 phospholipid/cholesterol/gamma-HCH transport system ATP-binding protein [Microbacter margulisiae]